ncbi:FAD/NAD(P)-binding protein [Microbacterium trichothecenolyticum]|uniref:NAD(P)/FAD-binding protein YdhS n=1 Tax=Microbacterium trichothecenolyticum TaxID=69370 RepID=A0ABU0TVR7_MICTR|nr:FAD/NAD(P)-binding protein [Microbacterium trichothecenolyticum]MDQ1123762.1 putative NAD(P)/FAD-binding protein YdhS [Microbacterium trichothecenolyticum]
MTDLVIVGAGPRAVMLVERLLARRTRAASPPLHITLVDPYPPGAGRIWRRAQSPLLKLNSMARDVTVFTDETSTISGPVRSGPSLIEWAERVRDGRIPDAEIDDPDLDAELRALRGDSFPTRRLQSAYLDWFWRRTVAIAPPGVEVQYRPGTVQWVDDTVEGYEVALDDGIRLPADIVVYALGHNGREPVGETVELIDAAARAGLTYVPPAFTADADLSVLAPGDDVIVRGMGLAAVDAIVLLAEGRGGRFSPAPDGTLRYEPSGLEPRLHLGSRRGVPYRSKVSSELRGDPPVREVLTAAAIATLLSRPGPVDFLVDVWPLIARELVWGHYRELFTGHPERVLVPWGQFRETLREVDGDTDALRRAVAEVVPDPLDRFDVPALDLPLAGQTFEDSRAAHDRVRRHIVEDLHLRTAPERSTSQALFLTTLMSFLALADIPTDRWSARSRAVDLPVTWHTFFSYVASGPPAHRLEELLALADAGIVRFLGPDVSVRVSDDGFVASSPRVGGEVIARALVDAWLPGSGAAASDNPALRELATRHGREVYVSDESFTGSLGRIDVDPDGRVIARDGTPHANLFAIGPFTSSTEAGAFTRPRSDSLSLRQTDRVAEAVSAAVATAAQARAFSG